MASILEMLAGQLTGDNLSKISSHLGTDPQSTGKAATAALPVLLGALSRNAARPEGAAALHQALAKDHDGSLLENLGGFLGGGAASGPGEGILRHVLGARQPAVQAGLARTSGLDAASMGKLLQMLAPMVMGALGKTQRQQGLDAGGLGSFLSQERQQVEKQSPQAAGLLGSLLDADGDGDVDLSDLVQKGSGLLGKFFSR